MGIDVKENAKVIPRLLNIFQLIEGKKYSQRDPESRAYFAVNQRYNGLIKSLDIQLSWLLKPKSCLFDIIKEVEVSFPIYKKIWLSQLIIEHFSLSYHCFFYLTRFN